MARDGGVVHGVDMGINGNSKAPRDEEFYFGTRTRDTRGSKLHPRTRNFPSGTWALVLQKTRGCLRLVDISRSQRVTFFVKGAPYLGNG